MGGETAAPQRPQSSYPLRAPGPVGKWIPSIYRDRIKQFYSPGQYEGQNLLAMMHDDVASGPDHVKLSVWHAPGLSRPTFEEAMKGNYEPTHVGAAFGPSWSTHWFRAALTIPKRMKDMELLELHWDANNEGMVWTEDGHPLQGLTGGGERIEWVLPDSFRDGQEHVIYIEMACNGMFGNAPGGDSIQPPNPNKYYQLGKADIVAVNPEARQLRIDVWIIGDAARELPDGSWEKHRAQKVCNDIIDTFRLGDRKSIVRCREIAREYIGNVDSEKVYASGTEPIVYGIGHCHIDTCWLWPWDETKRKVARSWSNQCDLIDRYPEHNFGASQAQQYKWLREYYPTVFDRVKAKVKEGRFQPIGGSWVEHDTNIPGGESLVRQFLYGQRFFEGHFGERSRTFWLPDTFGYSSQLPQLCRQAGMNRFLTQKLSWNNINNFPHTTFNWVALDGSQVVCHMPPAETYTASAHFGDVHRSISQHKSMDHDNTSLLVFGKGDGGGGPTWEHIEKLRRCRGMSDTTGGGALPRVHMGTTVDDFFDALERKAASGTGTGDRPGTGPLATWYGELYLELHRGTYTTQANMKKNNRAAEFMLRDIELLATIASVAPAAAAKNSAAKGYNYPKKDIDDMWEDVLLCQFHDCLPGSCIEMVYDDTEELYARVFGKGNKLLKELYSILGLNEASTHTLANNAVVLNTLPWARQEVVELPGAKSAVVEGDGMVLQARDLHAAEENGVTVKEVSNGVFVLENALLRVEVKKGSITSLWDKKAKREVVAKGRKANQLVLFDDKPLYWQAWDVEVYHLESREELEGQKTHIAEDKGFRASVVTETRISEKSSVKTTVSLAAAVEPKRQDAGAQQPAHVEVTAEVDWHETMKFLKVEFPVDVRATEASYETQYGVVRRPTHYNTSWDMSKFEVCGHKWADLSEHGYGVSVLNDSKYGFATAGNVMMLSLLRAPKAPDGHADMGKHVVRWGIMPHEGGLGEQTVKKGFEFNNALRVLEGGLKREFGKDPQALGVGMGIGERAVRLVGDGSLVLDTVKRGEDDEDVRRGDMGTVRRGRSIIVRVYDSLGGRSRGRIETEWEVERVWKTNLLEDDGEEVAVVRSLFDARVKTFEVDLKPFEVATFRLQL